MLFLTLSLSPSLPHLLFALVACESIHCINRLVYPQTDKHRQLWAWQADSPLSLLTYLYYTRLFKLFWWTIVRNCVALEAAGIGVYVTWMWISCVLSCWESNIAIMCLHQADPGAAFARSLVEIIAPPPPPNAGLQLSHDKSVGAGWQSEDYVIKSGHFLSEQEKKGCSYYV